MFLKQKTKGESDMKLEIPPVLNEEAIKSSREFIGACLGIGMREKEFYIEECEYIVFYHHYVIVGVIARHLKDYGRSALKKINLKLMYVPDCVLRGNVLNLLDDFCEKISRSDKEFPIYVGYDILNYSREVLDFYIKLFPIETEMFKQRKVRILSEALGI